MKPYILDDRTIIVAYIWPALLYLAIYASLFNILIEYKGVKTTTYFGVIFGSYFALFFILSIRQLRIYLKNKEPYLRIDKDGIFIHGDRDVAGVTVPWNQVEVTFIRRNDNKPSLFVHVLDKDLVYIFNLDPFIDGMNVYALRRALRHFSGREDIVKNRGIIIL